MKEILQRLFGKARISVDASLACPQRRAHLFFRSHPASRFCPAPHRGCGSQDLLGRGHEVRWVNVAVGDKLGTLPLTIASHDHSSTLALSESEARASGARQVPV